jgi:3-phenylpropionate/trans-cinnamate dioxygenase ferredoxin reductase component
MVALSRVVVVGASLAGLRACEALRKAGYEGALTLVGEESCAFGKGKGTGHSR